MNFHNSVVSGWDPIQFFNKAGSLLSHNLFSFFAQSYFQCVKYFADLCVKECLYSLLVFAGKKPEGTGKVPPQRGNFQ